jgi:hypothetical protein
MLYTCTHMHTQQLLIRSLHIHAGTTYTQSTFPGSGQRAYGVAAQTASYIVRIHVCMHVCMCVWVAAHTASYIVYMYVCTYT